MRILLDEGLPRRAAALLREKGIDAVHLTEIGEPSTADESILETARTDGRIIVTLDADFHALLAMNGWSAPSVIRIRRQGLSAHDVCELVARVAADHVTALMEGAALSVRAHLIGIRKLPLTQVHIEELDSDDDADR
jgi:predicted nuclease of predicted toxin-antitoxin system